MNQGDHAALAVVEDHAFVAVNSVMPVVSPEQARAQMEAYTALVNAVILDEDYQTFKERGKEKKFKKKSAVKKLQTYFGFSIEVVSTERDDLGEGHFGFRCKARATSPGGRFVEAMAGCSTTEERFDLTPNDWESGENDPKFLHRQRKALARAYHDVLSTAETRATNRAAMNLIGAGEVTAEEVSRPFASEREVTPPRQSTARVSQNEILDLARSRGIFDLKAVAPVLMQHGLAPNLYTRERPGYLTDAETVEAKRILLSLPVSGDDVPETAPEPRSADELPMTPNQQGLLFALLAERWAGDRHEFALQHGVTLNVRDGKPTYAGLTRGDAATLIRALEQLPLLKGEASSPSDPPEESLEAYAARRL